MSKDLASEFEEDLASEFEEDLASEYDEFEDIDSIDNDETAKA